MFIKVLQKLDFFGSKFHFYSEKSSTKETVSGGLLSIFIFCLFFLLLWVFGDDFFSRKNPSVTTSIEKNTNYEQIDLKKENILFAFRIEDYNGTFVNVSNILYFKIYYYTTEQGENGEFRKKISDEYLNYHICNDNDFKGIRNLTENFGILYCPELGGKKFGGYWDSPNLYYFEIQVYFCENGTQVSKNNTKCTSLHLLNEFLNQDHPKFFALYYPVLEFNPLSYNKPLINLIKNYYYCLSTRLQRNDDIFLKKTILNDDKGWFFSTNKNITGWGVDSITSTYSIYFDEDLNSDGISSKIYELNLYTIKENNYYIRNYIKIQSVIAIVGSFFNIIIYFCSIISNYAGEVARKNDILNYIFEFNDNCERNNLYIKHCQIPKNVEMNIFDKKEIISNFKSDENTFKITEKTQNINQNDEFVLKDLKHLKPKSLKGNSLNNTFNLNNSTKYDNKLKIDCLKNSVEQSGFHLLNKLNSNQKIISNLLINNHIHKNSNNNNEIKNIKVNYFPCCSNKNVHFSKLLHHYYIKLIQINRYLRIINELDFIKQILLNENQIQSLIFLKKINLKKNEVRNKLLEFKNYENIESNVISYYQMIYKSLNMSKIDNIILNNLSDKIKNKIMN